MRRNTAPDSFLRGDKRLTYEDLDRPATALPRWFLDEGLRAGDRVAVHWSNSTEVVRLFFAILKAGLIAVPLNLRPKPAGLPLRM